MGISSAAYDSLNPTNLDNLTNPLRLPGDGLMGIVDAPKGAPLRITTGRESLEVLPGKRDEISAYRVQQDGKTYVNPTFRVRAGADFSAELANGLDEETTIHWHGLHVDWHMDGHPLLPVAPDTTYRYAYPIENRAGTFWYHPHAHGTSARQIYSGLAGFFIVEDEEERGFAGALDLKLGETDIPLLVQDKMFDEGREPTVRTTADGRRDGLPGGRRPCEPDPQPLPGSGYQDLPLQAAQWRQRPQPPAGLLQGRRSRVASLRSNRHGRQPPREATAGDGGLPLARGKGGRARGPDGLRGGGRDRAEEPPLRPAAQRARHGDGRTHGAYGPPSPHWSGPAPRRTRVLRAQAGGNGKSGLREAHTRNPLRVCALELYRGVRPTHNALDGVPRRDDAVAHQRPHARYERVPHRGAEGSDGGLGGP